MIFGRLFDIFTSAKKTRKETVTARGSKPREVKKVTNTRIGELGEYKINIQLDQLPNDCKFISDVMIPSGKLKSRYSQIDHVIITPYGLFIIETKNHKGEIKGSRGDKYWVNKGHKLYNPLKQNDGHVTALKATLPDFPQLNFVSIVSFTMRCRFKIDPELRKIQSNELVVYDIELLEFIQRKLNRMKAESVLPIVSGEQIVRIHDAIQQVNITDPAIRQQHINTIKGYKK